MSSLAVRDAIEAFCQANFPAETYVDLTAEYQTITDLLEYYSLDHNSTWLGVEFSANPEIPVALNANNAEGGYREDGSVSFNFVAPAALGPKARAMLERAENFKKAIRGQRLGQMIVEEVIGPNTGAGAVLQFDSGFMCASIIIGYHIDISPTP